MLKQMAQLDNILGETTSRIASPFFSLSIGGGD